MGNEGVEGTCPFCNFIRTKRPVAQRGTFFAKYDEYPVTSGHVLLIPCRHVENPFELNEREKTDLFDLLLEMYEMLQRDFDPDGFNIGINVGQAAGQTVRHLHIHVIPRHWGDVENPRGGVRWVIPDQADYLSEDL